jgi:hypothetical protein
MIYLRETDPNKFVGSYKKDSIYTTIQKIKDCFGEPFYYEDENYPNDPIKTTVSIMLYNPDNHNIISLWDYKVWDHDNDEIDFDQEIEFSVYYDDIEDFKRIKNLLKEN